MQKSEVDRSFLIAAFKVGLDVAWVIFFIRIRKLRACCKLAAKYEMLGVNVFDLRHVDLIFVHVGKIHCEGNC